MGAGVAGAGGVERPRVVAVAGVADPDVAVAGEEPAVAGVSRGKHAVEHVDPRRHRLDDVLGRAHAHEIARPVRGQPRRGVRHDPAHVALGLADREPADRVAVESDGREPREGFVAQTFDHSTLDDAEKGVGVAFVRALGALGPAQGEAHRLRGVALARGVGRAFVEHHDDVGTQHPLDAHRFLGGEQEAIAVHRRGKAHAFLGDLAKLAEAEHLVASRVGEDGSRPADKAVQPAVRRDHLQARAQPQVKGVAEDDARAVLDELRGAHGLHRAVGADRHEHRGLDRSVRQLQGSRARGAVGRVNGEFHPDILSTSIASP